METLDVQQVSISNIYFNSYDGVWSHNVIINQKPFLKNKNLSFTLSETNILFIEINRCKIDKKNQDYGDNSLLIDINETDLSKKYFFSSEVTAIENGGQYNLSADNQEAIKQNGNIFQN